MSEFQLVPFDFGGKSIVFTAGADEPHSRVFAAIAARNTMRDPDVAEDILRDHGPDGDYQEVFSSIVNEYQQAYLLGFQPPEWFFTQARAYAAEHPTDGLLEVISFAEANRPTMAGPSERATRTRTVDRDKEKRKKKAAHKAKMRNKR